MNNFAEYITVDKALTLGDPRTRETLEEQARYDSLCGNCGVERVWRYAGTGLCFSCTTGEADASEDYELELVR